MHLAQWPQWCVRAGTCRSQFSHSRQPSRARSQSAFTSRGSREEVNEGYLKSHNHYIWFD